MKRYAGWISGFIIGGFGLDPKNVRVLGGLNPVAARPFDPAILPDIPFCSFSEWPLTTQINFHWTISEKEEQEHMENAAERRLRDAGHGDWVDAIRKEIARQFDNGKD